MIPVTAEERERYVREGLWSPTETLADFLIKHATERGEADAVVDAYGSRLSYAELHAAAAAVAAALAERGVEAGTVVGAQLPNRVESSVLACALELLGAVLAPLTPMFREREIGYVADVTGMGALVVPGTYRRHDHDEMAVRIAASSPSIHTLVTLTEDPPEPLVSLASMIAAGASFEPREVDPEAITAILMTSGTESNPKAVIHTNDTLFANNRALLQMIEMDESSPIFMASPVGHGTGYGFGTRLAVYLGSKLVLQDLWDAAQAAETISREGCVYTHASTTFAQDLLDLEGIEGYDLSSLRYFVSGGAAIPPGFAKRIHKAMDGCRLLRLYGQTEGFMTTLNRPGDPEERLDDSDGRAVPGVEVAIWDEAGEEVERGTTGELVCRGPHRCRGFLNDPERTARTIDPDGWMRMGDLGVMDEAGFIRVVGRVKEVISRGGYKYSPREVEDILSDHPRVSRIAVIRFADRRLGERACACVIPAGEGPLELEDLTSFLRERGLAPYKLPEKLELMSELPTTPAGKIRKFELEDQLAERLAE
ncbi:MAG TPA: AMP-binding protein [Solirubrobacterales bacterium]